MTYKMTLINAIRWNLVLSRLVESWAGEKTTLGKLFNVHGRRFLIG